MNATLTPHSDRRYVRKIISGLAVSALLLTGATVAEAGLDKKVYPGTMCHQRGTVTSQSAVRYESDGRIVNTSTAAVSIICPIVRDLSLERPVRAKMVVLDQHSSVNPTCSVRVIRPNGTVSGSLALLNNPNVVQLGIKVFEFGGFASPPAEDDAYFARCDSIPGSSSGALSGILSYSLTEETDDSIVDSLPPLFP